VQANFKAWLAQHQQASGNAFNPEQQHWLEMIRDHIAANLGIELEDFDYTPFSQQGGLGRVHQLFGEQLPQVMDELNRELVA
jgi:type I restriction enzyme, R subunit